MYQRLRGSQGNTLGYEVGGTVSERDFGEILDEVRAVVDEYGSARLLVRVRDWPSTETPTLGERLRSARRNLAGIERYAVVGEERAIAFLTSLADAFVDMDLRFFELDQEDEAWDWVRRSDIAQESPG